ncbi:MAG: hypothetical protein ABRQ25_00340 [Clostridiaceae bacterium]
MNDFLDDKITAILDKDEKIPESVIKKINVSYDIIREKERSSKVKKISFRKKYSMAAAMLLLVVSIFSYEPVSAAVKQFLFGINDAGIQTAVENNYMQKLANISAESGSVKIETTNIVIDPSKLGLILKLNFKNSSILKNINNITIDFAVKDEKGNIIFKDGSGINIIGGVNEKWDLSKKNTGEITDSIILESPSAKIPETKSISLEILNVYLYEKSQSPAKISGNWTLNIPLESILINRKTIKYTPINDNNNLEVLTAEAYPTGLIVKFTARNNRNDENIVSHAKLIDENSREYTISGGAAMENLAGNKDLVTMTFGATSFDNLNNLKLKVENLDGKDEFVTLKKIQ